MGSKTLFDVPPGATAQVSIIDTSLRLSNVAVDYLMAPPVAGFDKFVNCPTWSFLIQSSAGQKALFDLGVPPDIHTFSPAIVEHLQKSEWSIEVKQHVADILKDNGMDFSEIGSIIWSHWHWDHIGDPSTFPGTTEIVVGPGFKDAFLPAYPTNPDSMLRESYFEGRNLREIDFSQQQPRLKAGSLQAFDFFGDGSFYLLNTPGHAIGHLAGLARTTTNPDTFIFMGGDLCHHAGEIRPSPYLSIPDKVDFPLPDVLRALITTCPGGALFRDLNVKRGRGPDQPFFEPVIGHDIPLAIETIKKAQEADARDDVFFIFAHDAYIMGIVDLFPLRANEWSEKGWAKHVLWSFLGDLTPAVLAK
ncbi:beta-lactamase-like protein [Coniochaeta sp. 2T2.1]|nr:beta-lactamase-like protein [Coniochaeta sp. 2T2.1]